MSKLVLIPWAQTDWSAQGRMASQTALSLNEEGQRQAEAWAEALAGLKFKIIFCGEEQTAQETAGIMAYRWGARQRVLEDLDEIDLGLWEGLTRAELQRRYPKISKTWQEDPASVRPPEGEAVVEGAARIRKRVERIAAEANGKTVGLVLGPIAFALARCVLESAELDQMKALGDDLPLCYELTDKGQAKPEPARIRVTSVSHA
jgi:broad specificity phosphatase PhoE